MRVLRVWLMTSGLLAALYCHGLGMPISPQAIAKAGGADLLSEDILAGPPEWVDAPAPIPAQGHMGSYKVLLILIQFSNKAHVFSTASFDSMAFGVWPTGSVADYYAENSYGNLLLSGQVRGWYVALNNRAYYGNGQKGWGTYPHNTGRLVEEAVDAAQAAGCDFSQFDNDGDGRAESIIVVHCGEGAESSLDANDIQSHVSSITSMGGTARTYDGVVIDRYACCPELQTSIPATHINIGVYCHEYGHLLGLPDLYDVGWRCTAVSGWGIGAWGLMAYGGWGGDVQSPQSPTHMCAWSKIQMGWLTPTPVVGRSQIVTLNRLEEYPEAIKIAANQRATEYFLVAYRDSSYGFDRSLVKRGLMIWHIDDDCCFQNDCENGGSCTSGGLNYLVALEQPDGSFDLDCGTAFDYADRGDVYPYAGISEFTSGTNPNSDTYEGTASGVTVSGIAFDAPGRMSMCVTGGQSYPQIGYDDGGRDNCYTWGTSQSGFAVRISPPQYPALVRGLQIMSCDPAYPDFRCRIWDDNGLGGTPGTALSTVHTTAGAAAWSWTYEDFSADSIVIDSGDFWAVYIDYNNSDIGTDESSPWSGRTMMYYLDRFYPDSGAYGNYMIRAVLDTVMCTAGIEEGVGETVSVSVRPNPFIRAAEIVFAIDRSSDIALSVFDVRGRLVKTLAGGRFSAGTHSISWDGTDRAGNQVGAGIYFYRMTSRHGVHAGRMSLLR